MLERGPVLHLGRLGDIDAGRLPPLRLLDERRREDGLGEDRQIGYAESGEFAFDPLLADLRLAGSAEAAGGVELERLPGLLGLMDDGAAEDVHKPSLRDEEVVVGALAVAALVLLVLLAEPLVLRLEALHLNARRGAGGEPGESTRSGSRHGSRQDHGPVHGWRS
jgi:hypothetical protein